MNGEYYSIDQTVVNMPNCSMVFVKNSRVIIGFKKPVKMRVNGALYKNTIGIDANVKLNTIYVSEKDTSVKLLVKEVNFVDAKYENGEVVIDVR